MVLGGGCPGAGAARLGLVPAVPPGRAVPARLRGQQSESRAEKSLVGIRASCSCPITSQRFLCRAWAHSSGDPAGVFHDFPNHSLPSSSLSPRPQAPCLPFPVSFSSPPLSPFTQASDKVTDPELGAELRKGKADLESPEGEWLSLFWKHWGLRTPSYLTHFQAWG